MLFSEGWKQRSSFPFQKVCGIGVWYRYVCVYIVCLYGVCVAYVCVWRRHLNKNGLGRSFPVVLSEEQRQNLGMFIDPVTKFFEVCTYTLHFSYQHAILLPFFLCSNYPRISFQCVQYLVQFISCL